MIRPLALRRLGFCAALLVASALAIYAHETARASCPRLVYFTGWALLALMLVLTGYNARKKLAFLPLLKSSTWFQIHVYLGLFTGLAFLLHLQWRVPTGWFEISLASLFAGVTFSGIFGWWYREGMTNSGQLALGGFLTFVAGIAWNVRYSLRALAAPAHAYDGRLMIGGFIAAAGVIAASVGLRGLERGR